MEKGLIVKNISNQYTVQVAIERFICNARGRFRFSKDIPVVGDKVLIDTKKCTIEKILPRTNKLDRPVVANIDYALILTSVKEPDLSLNLLDKLLSIIKINNIEPVICFSKTDLLSVEEQKDFIELENYYKKVGYKVYRNTDLDDLKKALKDKIVVVTGQTGAGKSTLLNKLDQSLNLATSPISKALNRGVHTTRHIELYNIEDVYIVDTPGFSSIDFNNVTLEQLKFSFLEFDNHNCKYKDCMHDKEDNCDIKHSVNEGYILKSRYENYLIFKKEIYENSSKLYK